MHSNCLDKVPGYNTYQKLNRENTPLGNNGKMKMIDNAKKWMPDGNVKRRKQGNREKES